MKRNSEILVAFKVLILTLLLILQAYNIKGTYTWVDCISISSVMGQVHKHSN